MPNYPLNEPITQVQAQFHFVPFLVWAGYWHRVFVHKKNESVRRKRRLDLRYFAPRCRRQFGFSSPGAGTYPAC